MRIVYDPAVDSLHFDIGDRDDIFTQKRLNKDVTLFFNKEDRFSGIEILQVSKYGKPELLSVYVTEKYDLTKGFVRRSNHGEGEATRIKSSGENAETCEPSKYSQSMSPGDA